MIILSRPVTETTWGGDQVGDSPATVYLLSCPDNKSLFDSSLTGCRTCLLKDNTVVSDTLLYFQHVQRSAQHLVDHPPVNCLRLLISPVNLMFILCFLMSSADILDSILK